MKPVLVVVVFLALLALLSLPATAQEPPTCPTPTPAPTETPLLTQIEYFDAYCVPAGVRFDWAVSSEVGVTHYTIERIDPYPPSVVLDIPANCPGCQNGAFYSVTVETDVLVATYRLYTGVNSALVYTTCPPPTAVRLTSMEAK